MSGGRAETTPPEVVTQVACTGVAKEAHGSLRWISIGLLWAGLAVCVQPLRFPTAAQSARQRMAALLVMRRPMIPKELADELLSQAGENPWHIACAAEAAVSRFDDAAAIELYHRLPRDGGRWELIAARGLARRALIRGRLGEAEREFRRALALSPNDLEVLERLGHLLQVEGRVWEAGPYFWAQIVRGRCTGDELLGAAASDRFFRHDEDLERHALEQSPPEPLIHLAIARRMMTDNHLAQAEPLLRSVVAAVPDSGEAQGRLGRFIVDRGDLSEFLHWRGGLSETARAHPEVWYVQGLQARQSGQLAGATRCFLQAIELAPNHRAAHVQLAACLEQLGRHEAAAAFQARGERLAELDLALNLVRSDTTPENILRIIPLLEALGRYWEAAGWASRLAYLPVERRVFATHFRRCFAEARGGWWQQDPARLPARLVNPSDFPLPHWELPARPRMPVESPAAPDVGWRFEEEARLRGIDFSYFEGTSEQNRLEHIFNVMGGGLGVLDYDRDGWPDLYFAQANQWRDPAPQPEHFDRLFRNRAGSRFVDHTAVTGLGDLGFSHGVAVGDFDQDGFPDVYLGNLGPNRLYRNNGDGTFEERALEAGVAGDEWTTSSVFADLNQDGLPDLFVLNYTQREETAQRECGTPARRQACTPDLLTAQDDRCYLNLGNGEFRDISVASGIAGSGGKGLGVVAWDFLQDGRLGLFVANDTTPDVLWLPHGLTTDRMPQFQNEAVLRGIAFDIDGNVQASMGVAAGDVTGDGRLDILITDFYGSGNALYAQDTDGFFQDVSRAYGIHDPSLTMLGFGCQFADFDGDGWSDLIVTNGHVDQPTSDGGRDRMPPQLYHNRSGQRFELVPTAALGPFFQQGQLGRGLAILDWNRDGRTDVAISHLHAPAALVTNRTPAATLPLVVRLVGRNGSRDPTGARIELLESEPPQVRMQTAGDGFLVTNERRHVFAVPPDRGEVRVQVRWPSGPTEVFSGLVPGSEVLLIEGRGRGLTLPKLRAE